MEQKLTLAEIMNLDGERVVGAGVEEVAAIQEKLSMTGKPWCAVSAWVVIDVTCGPRWGLARFTLPLALYAHHEQLGDDDRLKAGEPALTSFATGYDQRGIFETVVGLNLVRAMAALAPAELHGIARHPDREMASRRVHCPSSAETQSEFSHPRPTSGSHRHGANTRTPNAPAQSRH